MIRTNAKGVRDGAMHVRVQKQKSVCSIVPFYNSEDTPSIVLCIHNGDDSFAHRNILHGRVPGRDHVAKFRPIVALQSTGGCPHENTIAIVHGDLPAFRTGRIAEIPSGRDSCKTRDLPNRCTTMCSGQSPH